MTTHNDRGPKTRVFISYSRKDLDFVRRLASALGERAYPTDFDLSERDPTNIESGISVEDAWWERRQGLIAKAEAIVLVLSPDSAASRVCDEEIAFARALGKRMIPILCRSVDFSSMPPRLRALNVNISFVENEDFDGSLAEVCSALDLDVTWHRELARLAVFAARWHDAGRPSDSLIRGKDIGTAEQWAARRPLSAPPPSDIVLAFLTESRQADDRVRAVGEVQRARYLEIERVTRPMLEAELAIRESLPDPGHAGVADEMRGELELVRSLVGIQKMWHPKSAIFGQITGARDGYAEIFRFPCCNRIVKDFLSGGEGDLPSQFRADGCEEIPTEVQYSAKPQSNPFASLLALRYGEAHAASPSYSPHSRDSQMGMVQSSGIA